MNLEVTDQMLEALQSPMKISLSSSESGSASSPKHLLKKSRQRESSDSLIKFKNHLANSSDYFGSKKNSENKNGAIVNESADRVHLCLSSN